MKLRRIKKNVVALTLKTRWCYLMRRRSNGRRVMIWWNAASKVGG